MRSAPGFTAGKPPEWDVERFLRGDEIDTALITLERNRRTFAWKCADVGAESMALQLAGSPMTLGGLVKPEHICPPGLGIIALQQATDLTFRRSASPTNVPAAGLCSPVGSVAGAALGELEHHAWHQRPHLRVG